MDKMSKTWIDFEQYRKHITVEPEPWYKWGSFQSTLEGYMFSTLIKLVPIKYMGKVIIELTGILKKYINERQREESGSMKLPTSVYNKKN